MISAAMLCCSAGCDNAASKPSSGSVSDNLQSGSISDRLREPDEYTEVGT